MARGRVSPAHADCVLLLSGGIDSTTVLAGLVAEGRRPYCLTFDYGQTLLVEIAFAVANAKHFQCPHAVVRLDLRAMAPDCAILSPVFGRTRAPDALPRDRTLGQIAHGGTPPSYVPFRNGVFLSYAVGFGEARGLEDLYCGGNGLASGNYWDDTTTFAARFEAAAREGTAPSYRPRVRFPLAGMSKADVATWYLALGLPESASWSCYLNGRSHCGSCDSCVQRTAAFNACVPLGTLCPPPA